MNGDIRARNIVTKGTAEVVLIDFDMLGKHGQSAYISNSYFSDAKDAAVLGRRVSRSCCHEEEGERIH